LQSQDQAAIKEYLAKSDDNSAVFKFISTVAFVREVTGYTFTDRHLLLQALHGNSGSENPQQRLAMLGDTLLQYVLKDDWFQLGLATSESSSRLEDMQSSLLTVIA
jgi:dsRNA-specific ribonuclease